MDTLDENKLGFIEGVKLLTGTWKLDESVVTVTVTKQFLSLVRVAAWGWSCVHDRSTPICEQKVKPSQSTAQTDLLPGCCHDGFVQ